jgi:protein involved in polysaccharide export with SLBB domain
LYLVLSFCSIALLFGQTGGAGAAGAGAAGAAGAGGGAPASDASAADAGQDYSAGGGQTISGRTSLQPSLQYALSVPNYPVTAGDIYLLAYNVGSTAVEFPITVDTSYSIRVSNLRVINARGLTYRELKQQVEDIVTKNYPLSGVQFALRQPSVFRVFINGEVSVARETSTWALARLSTVLAGSLTSRSSIRDVEVRSSGGTSRTYDLFRAQRFGEVSQDPYLRPDDTIIVQPVRRAVSIGGTVQRPGTYQLIEGDNLKKLVEYYGSGLTPLADTSRITLTRQINDIQSPSKVFYLTNTDIAADFELNALDVVAISSLEERSARIFLQGAVVGGQTAIEAESQVEGSYRLEVPIRNGTHFASFVRSYRSYFTNQSADLEKVYIERAGERILVNVHNILYGSFNPELVLQNEDIITIPFKQMFVSVTGAVVTPGKYPYIQDRTYEYYVSLAGGFSDANAFNAVELRDFNNNKLDKNAYIMPESIIEAKRNSFLYGFNRIAPVVTTILSIVTTTISVLALIQQ